LLQGTIQKYNKQEKYNNTSYREHYKNTTNRKIEQYLLQGTIQIQQTGKYNNTSYREQYQNTTNRNNAKILATGTIPKY
jgi:hypothetical protein